MGILRRLFGASRGVGLDIGPPASAIGASIEEYTSMIRRLHPSIDTFVREDLAPTLADGALLDMVEAKFRSAVADRKPHSIGTGDDRGVFYSVSVFPNDLQQARAWYGREFTGYLPYLDRVLQGVSGKMELQVLCHIAVGKERTKIWSQVSIFPVARGRSLPALVATDLLSPGEKLPGQAQS